MSTLLRGAPVAERLTLDLSRRSAALRHRGVIPTLAILRAAAPETWPMKKAPPPAAPDAA